MTPREYTLIGADGKPYASAEPGTLGGHRGTKIYGRLDCPGAARAIARGGYVRSRVFFADEATARGAGYRPCFVCLREDYRAWKAGWGHDPAQAAGRRRR
jgi:methylphosphotriester-DNA--protein-cysteine methyltransferase